MISMTIIIFLVLITFISGIHCENIEVSVKLGRIKGFKEEIKENEVNVFLGIPFAMPPIGGLRFRKPQPITKKWTETLDATKWPKICMQVTLPFFSLLNNASEDCLYLNVWTPVNLDKDFSLNLRPVMVFIHGGAFTFMGISYKHHNASVLSSFGNVVIVSMNYRLGAFGFLSAGNTDAPGNVGLYDQALALEWVQENIAYFGGDPKRVTLFGESAGAWSTSLHLLSPVSQDMFRRAIIMSGAIFQGVAMDTKDEAVRKALELSKLLGCDVKKRENHVKDTHMECLRKADAEKIVELQSVSQITSLSKSLVQISFMPTIGEAFIPKEPRELLEQKSFNEEIDVLVGTMANEGYIMHLGMEMSGLLSKTDKWDEKLRFFAKALFKDLSNEEIEEILSFYFNDIDEKNSDEAKMAYYTAVADVYFNCETIYFSNVFSKVNHLYQYLFDYPLENAKDNWAPCDLYKACHGNEIPVTFGTVSNPDDIEVSEKWMTIMTDFAKRGTVEWPKYRQASSPYYEFKGDKWNDRLLHNFRNDACKLWKPIFDKQFKTLFISYP